MLRLFRLAHRGPFGTPVAFTVGGSFSERGIDAGTFSMWDAVFITSSVLFFVVCWLYVVACERC
jgi:hypothetical protein